MSWSRPLGRCQGCQAEGRRRSLPRDARAGPVDDDAVFDPHASSSSVPHHSGEAAPPVLPITLSKMAEPHAPSGEAEASDAETLEYNDV